MIRATALLPLLATVVLLGCNAPGGTVASGDRPATVDSIRTLEEDLERFRSTILEPVDSLAPVASSRDELVRRFIAALEREDTLTLDSLVLGRAEFAYLYYPSSRYTSEPYRLDPALLWFLVGENGHKGRVRALRHYGGQKLAYEGVRCDPEPRREGENLLWTGCVVLLGDSQEAGENGSSSRFAASGDERGGRLFGSIIERGGRFKFVSYSNAL